MVVQMIEVVFLMLINEVPYPVVQMMSDQRKGVK